MERPKELSEMTINKFGDIQESPLPRQIDKMQELIKENQKIKNYFLQIQKHSASYLVYSDELSNKEKNDITISPQKVSDFYFYLRKWKEETAGLSSPASIRMNKNYQIIIGLGDSIIPLILKELEREPDDWFYALEILTQGKENPVTNDMGFNDSVKAWIGWGKSKGHI